MSEHNALYFLQGDYTLQRVFAYQHILEFDISVKQSLTMQEPNPFNHVQSYLHPRPKVQPDLESSVEVTGIARHDEKDNSVGTI